MACTVPSNPGAWEVLLSQHHILPYHAARNSTMDTSAMDHDQWCVKNQRNMVSSESDTSFGKVRQRASKEESHIFFKPAYVVNRDPGTLEAFKRCVFIATSYLSNRT